MTREFIEKEYKKNKFLLTTTYLSFEFITPLLNIQDRIIFSKFKKFSIGLSCNEYPFTANGYLIYLLDIPKSKEKNISLLKKLSCYIDDFPYGRYPYGNLHCLVINCPVMDVYNKFINLPKEEQVFYDIYTAEQLEIITTDKYFNTSNKIGLLALDILTGKTLIPIWNIKKETFK